MAKIALLIGISDYSEGISSLPGTQTDIQVMQRVLEDAQVGGFDHVKVLANPNRTEMETAIEILFSENCSKDDLILLYFSGHGIRDDQGQLYLAAKNTQKNDQGRVRVSTAVSSVALHGYMSQSRSKRQVLILDCCFSGAFANNMKAKSDEAIDIGSQLGSEGRAVLTSSTAIQESYETEGVSVYTRYLVQGLETGAADQDGDGQVTVDELHEYAKEKVQEESPSMLPEIYAVREGYKIVVARAPQGDPKLVYRKELNKRVKQKQGLMSPIDRRTFRFRAQELGLSQEESQQIDEEILQPYLEFWKKLDEFEEAVVVAKQNVFGWTEEIVDDLQYFQRVLKLRDEDIAPVLERQGVSLTEPSGPVAEDLDSPFEVKKEEAPCVVEQEDIEQPLTTMPTMPTMPVPSSPTVQQINNPTDQSHYTAEQCDRLWQQVTVLLEPPIARTLFQQQGRLVGFDGEVAQVTIKTKQLMRLAEPRIEKLGIAFEKALQHPVRVSMTTAADFIPLESEKGVDYTKLRDLLAAADWKGADYETYLRMLEAVGRNEGDWIRDRELRNFPCADLRTIDRLWVHYSQGHFGFSVQKEIYIDCGAKLDGKYPGNEIWDEFCCRVGWRVEDQYISYSDVTSSIKVQKAHFPIVLGIWGVGGSDDSARVGILWGSSLISRLVNCSSADFGV